MDSDEYSSIKAACEGRQIPAYEAASEFISQVAGNLDDLLEQISGEKHTLNTLAKLEKKRDESLEQLQQAEAAGPEQLSEMQPQLLKAANRAQSQVNQADAVSRMVRDQMLKNKDKIQAWIAEAGQAAASAGGAWVPNHRYPARPGGAGLCVQPAAVLHRDLPHQQALPRPDRPAAGGQPNRIREKGDCKRFFSLV